MTRVLITGIGGFIGSHLMDHVLETTDWDIVGTDSFRHKGLSDRIRNSRHWEQHRHRVSVFAHDLNGPMSRALMHDIGSIDYLINVASESHVDRSIVDPVTFTTNNVALVLNVLEYARIVRPRAVLHVSTDEVFGPAPDGYAHHEWDAILPSNPYAASKAAQEAIAIAHWRTYDVPLLITNTMNNFGERQDVEKFIPKAIRAIVSGETMPIHGQPSTGESGSRFYLHARNHADAICWLLQHAAPARYPHADRPDRYNIVGDRELSNLAMARHLADIIGKPLRYEIVDFHGARPGHDRRYALDGSKLAGCGWHAPVEFHASLARTVEWYLTHPETLELSEQRSAA